MKYILLIISCILIGCSNTKPKPDDALVKTFHGPNGLQIKSITHDDGTTEILWMGINGDGISDEMDEKLFVELLNSIPGVTIEKLHTPSKEL